jgi:RIO kinase 1
MSTAISFKQLMDEELARKLQEEEQEREIREQLQIELLLKNQEIDNQYDDYYDDEYFCDDYAAVEDGEKDTVNGEQKPDTESTPALTDEELARKLAEEEDYLSALRLQQEMENEQYLYMYNQRYAHPHQKSNVAISYGLDDFLDRPLRYSSADIDADDELEESKSTPNPIKAMAASRGKKKKPTTTKHDPEKTSKYNAENIEKFMDSALAENNIRLPTNVYNRLKEHSRQLENNRIRYRSKEDHASYEQAMDPRTRLMLYKMLNTGVLDAIHGVVSTGKEANVYHAEGHADPNPRNIPQHKAHLVNLVGGEYAVKVFKTTLNEFKNREEYIEGEWRFRFDKFSHQNPRRLIKLWAQKEMRNLKRMHRVGIRCPTPVLLRDHILIMSFIGHNGAPAPHLKDLNAPVATFVQLYNDVIKMMRKLYQEAGLIHADLSAFNILVFDGLPYFIDVSQAVENDHPSALDFLRRDCQNISEFFKSKGVDFCMSTRQLFDFVTDKSIGESNIDAYLLAVENENRAHPYPTNEEMIEAGVFRHSFIPRTLSQVTDPLYELEQVKYGKHPDIFHTTVTGLRSDLCGIADVPEILVEDPNTTEDDEE